jgi:multicomponent K+:H+ antiporter subunit E
VKSFLSWLILPCILLAVWLLLNRSLAPGQILLGAALGLALAWLAMALRPLRAMLRRPWKLAPLLARVVYDVAKSNVQVARLIWLGPPSHSPGFMHIPLSLRDPHGLALLACIITYTPGTVWAGFSEETGVLTLHVLDLKDRQYWVNLIQQRYERPLKEIFE